TTASSVTGATILSGAVVRTLSARTKNDPKTTPAETIGPRSPAPISTPRLRGARAPDDTLQVLLFRVCHNGDPRIQVLQDEREGDRGDQRRQEDHDRERLRTALPEDRLVRERALHGLELDALGRRNERVVLAPCDVSGERRGGPVGEVLRPLRIV